MKLPFLRGLFLVHARAFAEAKGVIEYTRLHGRRRTTTYRQVCSHDRTLRGGTGTFDPDLTSYEELLDIFWRQIDPTDAGGQFFDRGSSYRTAVFYLDEAQREKAEASKEALNSSGRFNKPVVTAVLPASTFYPAEDYHHDYHKKNPVHYKQYRRVGA